ncbi:MAG: cob(I)yrinic acid a,c-diamide adenosyltransferase [Ruminococcaceae bacterium]|nr:cob(I)yrinic acid a,c-diamide adenosyltransferase [Oscillospiraceae bacterium]
MIQAYFGNGKGKTTAAIGAVIRCVGCGQKALYVGFLKNNDSAEFKVLDTLENIDMLFSNEKYNLYDNEKPELTPKIIKAYTKLLFDETARIITGYQMIVLDEILDAIQFGYVDEDEFIKVVNEWKNRVEIILTGHALTEKIKDISDYISEIKNTKHPYADGVLARKGIEY